MDRKNDITSSSTHSDIPDFHLDSVSSSADLKETSEDVSYASETVKNSLHLPEDPHSGTDHQSLTEFEEIERIIQQNTAVDTEDEEEEEDDREKLLSPDTYREAEFHPDTGYQTVEGFEYAQSPVRSNSVRSFGSRTKTPDVSEEYPSRRSSRTAVSNHEMQSSLEKSGTDLDVTLDRFLTRHDEDENISDDDDDEKLVATFGTTENLEDLLERQLQDMADEEENSEHEQIQNETKSPLSRLTRESTKERPTQRSSTQPRNSTLPQPRSSTLPQLSRQSTRPPRFRRAVDNRTTRSPAANRVKKAHQRSRANNSRTKSPAFPESSDGDLSVRSDVSRTELRQRLKREHKDRKKEKEVATQLQTDYDDLVTKYAQAENVIDQLRIGAKIDLFASLPTGVSAEDFNRSTKPDANYPSNVHASPRPSPRQKKNSSVASNSSHAVDSLTESSLKLPSAASSEFLRIALEHQANDLKDQMESFKQLLNGGHVADDEKRQVLRNLEEALRSLERDYMAAGNDHATEKIRSSIYGENKDPTQSEEFDPNHKIEGEIFRLGRMFEGIKDDVYASNLPQTPLSSRKSYVSDGRKTSSSESSIDLEAGFNEQLKRYHKQPPTEDAFSHTTASSRILSSDDEDLLNYQKNIDDDDDESVSEMSRSTVKDSDMPERFLRPPSANTSGSLSQSRIIETADELSPVRPQDMSRSSSGSPRSRPRSRLPRPVGSRSHSTPVMPKKQRSNSRDAEVDSGFQGSERSAQSSIPSTTAQQQQKPRSNTSPPNYQKLRMQHQPNTSSTPVNPTKPVIKQGRDRTTSSGSTNLTKLTKPTASPKPTRQVTPKSSSTTKGRSWKPDGQETNIISGLPPKPVSQKMMSNQDTGNQMNHSKEPPTLIAQDSPQYKQPFSSGPSQHNTGFSPQKPLYRGSSGSILAPTDRGSIESEFEWVPREKSRPSSRRSVTSSSKDSTLGLLRGEIAKLRQEIAESKKPQQTYQRPPSFKHHSKSEISESEYSSPSRRRGSETKDRTKRIFPQRTGSFKSRIEDDLDKQTQARETRNVKSGGDIPINKQETDLNRENRDNMPTSGHWAYISSYPAPTVPIIRPQPMYYYPTVVPASPIAPRMGSVYMTTPPPMYGTAVTSPARIYVPAASPVHVMHETIPYESARGRSRSRRSSRRSSYVELDSDDENDLPLRRSHLVSTKRSSSVPPLHQSYLDPQLSLSLRRAEKASDSVRSKSRAMYRSLRDSLNRSELLL